MHTEQSRPTIEPGMSRREYRALVAAWERDQAIAEGPSAPVPAIAASRGAQVIDLASAEQAAPVPAEVHIQPVAHTEPVATAAVEYENHYTPAHDYQVGFEDYAAPQIPAAQEYVAYPVDSGWGTIVSLDVSGYPTADSTGVISLDSRRARRDVHKTTAPSWLVGKAPRVGLVGALGVAAVVAPLALSGGVGDTAHTQTVHDSSGQDLSGSDTSTQDKMGNAGAKLPDLSSQLSSDAMAKEHQAIKDDATRRKALAAQREAAAKEAAQRALQESEAQARQLEQERQRAAEEKASRDRARNPLPGCSGVAPKTKASNGRLNISTLCKLPQSGHRLRADAAVDFARLNAEYKAVFGKDIPITDSYRTLASQRRLKARKPRLAATPGTSNHGWGLALDLGGNIPARGKEYHWLRKNAPKYGWDNPAWARRGGSGPYEPWHWEYKAAK